MISSELTEQSVRAACLVDLSKNGDAPKFVRDKSIIVEQINQLFQLDAFETANIDDHRFWHDENLKLLINLAIRSQQRKTKVQAINDALQAMQQSYNLAYPHKTFGSS